MTVIVNCTQCGKPVERRPYEAKCENSFCCRECYDTWRSKKRVTVTCSNCGKIYDIHAFREGNPHYFCGRKCRGEWMSKNNTGQNHCNYVERVKINCACCGVEMERVPNKVGKYNFCSKSCASKSTSLWAPKKRVTVRCSYCDKPIERHPRYVNNTNFCDHGCMGKWFSENWVGENHPMSGDKSPAWRGGISFEPYPVTWNNKLKGDIRSRDNHTCQVCGVSEVDSGRKLDVHHIDYDKNNLNYSNLISLCMSCHRKTNHRRDEWKAYFQNIDNSQEVAYGN